MKDKVEGIKIEKSVVIRRSPEELYRFWRNFENLPRVMSHLKKVTMTHGKRSHWEAKGPAGTTVQWDAELIDDKENEMISWKALEKADVPNTGSVHFIRIPGDMATEVRVMIQYDPPAGKLGAAIARLLGEDPSQQVEEDLRRFKEVMEKEGGAAFESKVA
jgi:uncharacterized membrane protein